MKNKDVLEAFLEKECANSLNLCTDGQKLFSYSTCIAQWLDDNTIVVNTTWYSNTTSKYRNYIMKQEEAKFYVEDVPKGEQNLSKYFKRPIDV